MADWTDLPNAAVGVGGIPSGTTVTALRDNPIAIAEGATGAPSVQVAALVDKALFTPNTLVSRAVNTAYINSLPYSIVVTADAIADSGGAARSITLQVDPAGGTSYQTWALSRSGPSGHMSLSAVVPKNARWRVTTGGTMSSTGVREIQ